MKQTLFYLALLCSSATVLAQPSLLIDLQGKVDITVDATGGGDYKTVQAAIDAVPNNSTHRTVVLIKNGRYYEKVRISSSKKNLVLIGEDLDKTVITYDDYAGNTGFDCTTVRVDPDDFLAMNLTIENTFQRSEHPNVTGTQALALATYGDRQMFAHCKLESDQDTYYSGSERRAYFKDCLIIGDVDFIYGPTTILFDSCQIHNVRSGAYFTAASTPQDHKFGYVFKHCWLTFDKGIRDVWLGRPWRPYAHVCWFENYMADGVNVAGWHNWGNSANEATARYEEYNCYGPGADTAKRVSWGKQLTAAQAATYTTENIYAKASNPAVSADWMPTLEENELYALVKKNTYKFLSPELSNGKLTGIKVNGTPVEDFDPEALYTGIELPSGTTAIPTLSAEVSSDQITTSITLPEQIPGFGYVDVSTPYKAMNSRYSIYFSVDNAYHNANIKYLIMLYDTVEYVNAVDTLYQYGVPNGTSPYFRVRVTPEVEGASSRIIKPKEIPARYQLEITAIDKVTVKNYWVDVFYGALGNPEIQISEDQINFTFQNPTNGLLTGNISVLQKGTYQLYVYDTAGQLIMNHDFGALSATPQSFEVNTSQLKNGIYLYKVIGTGGQTSGKLIKASN